MSETIKLNRQRKSDLEFDVAVQGIDEDQTVDVRFVIEGKDYNRTFICNRVADTEHTWVVNLPALTWIKDNSCPFHIEVLIDDYYFEPTCGEIDLSNDKPEVSTSFKQEKNKKPKVSTSFNVKQEDKPEKSLKEASGGGEVTSTVAPTNGLLRKEEPPLQSSTPTSDHSKADDDIDVEELFNNILPGEGSSYTEKEASGEKSAREFVADLIKNTTGALVVDPKSKRSLFKRDAQGRTIDQGFEHPDVIRRKQENDAKVRQILDNIK